MALGIWQLLIVLAIIVLLLVVRSRARLGGDRGVSGRGFEEAASEAADRDASRDGR